MLHITIIHTYEISTLSSIHQNPRFHFYSVSSWQQILNHQVRCKSRGKLRGRNSGKLEGRNSGKLGGRIPTTWDVFQKKKTGKKMGNTLAKYLNWPAGFLKHQQYPLVFTNLAMKKKWNQLEDVWTLLKMGIFQLAMLVYLSVSSLCQVQCLQIRYLNPLVNVMDNYRIVEVIEDEAEMTLGGFTFQRAYSLLVGSLEHLPKQRLGEGGSFFFQRRTQVVEQRSRPQRFRLTRTWNGSTFIIFHGYMASGSIVKFGCRMLPNSMRVPLQSTAVAMWMPHGSKFWVRDYLQAEVTVCIVSTPGCCPLG